MEVVLILLAVSIAVIWATVAMAARKDRSKFGWFIASLFFGIFALIILACLSDRNKDRAKLAAAIRAGNI